MELLEAYPEVLAQVEVIWVDAGDDGDKFALSVWLMIQRKFLRTHELHQAEKLTQR